ncbi:TetR family transcriptional regulator [Agrococcus versicolor]|uniref:TetR family transcriptional regulator n=1 Tax=Agrococcus versicolor TaxID=501482 RepID=A0ABN3AIH6_9MICO
MAASDAFAPPEAAPPSTTSLRLLDAAAALIDERGIDRITMTDVAVRAGVSVGTAYRHHADRDALVRALFDRHTALAHRMLVEAASTPHGSLESDVRALLDATLRVHRTVPAYQAVRTWQWLRPEARGDRTVAVEALAGALSDVLAPRWGVAQDEGHRERIVDAIRRADALVLASFLDDPTMDDAAIDGVLAAVEAMLVPVLRADVVA